MTNRSTATRRASRSCATGAAGHSTSRGARSPAIATAFPTPPRPRRRSRILHLGLYAYRRDFLLELGSLPPSPLEAAEKLEQLRVLEAGYPIAVGLVDEPSVGIDTPEDYRRFVARWRPSQAHSDLITITEPLIGLFMTYHLSVARENARRHIATCINKRGACMNTFISRVAVVISVAAVMVLSIARRGPGARGRRPGTMPC